MPRSVFERLAAQKAQCLAILDHQNNVKRSHREIKALGRDHLPNYADEICIFIKNYKATTRWLNNPEDHK